MDQVDFTLRTHKFFICMLVFVTQRLVELLESPAAISSSELCHADGLYYMDVSGCNLLVDNSGKRAVVMGTDAQKHATGFCHCHGNKFNYHAFIPRAAGAVLSICSRLSESSLEPGLLIGCT